MSVTSSSELFLGEHKTPGVLFMFQIPRSFDYLVNLAGIVEASIYGKNLGLPFDLFSVGEVKY